MKHVNDNTYGDQVIDNAMADATGWLQAGEAKKAVNSGITALKRAAEELAHADFASMKPEIAARTAAYLAKMIDEVSRLIEFAAGKADSRPEVTVSAFLLELTDEELAFFDKALARIEAKAAGRPVQ